MHTIIHSIGISVWKTRYYLISYFLSSIMEKQVNDKKRAHPTLIKDKSVQLCTGKCIGRSDGRRSMNCAIIGNLVRSTNCAIIGNKVDEQGLWSGLRRCEHHSKVSLSDGIRGSSQHREQSMNIFNWTVKVRDDGRIHDDQNVLPLIGPWPEVRIGLEKSAICPGWLHLLIIFRVQIWPEY